MAWGSFEELEVYKECRKLRQEVSRIAKEHFPSFEKYLLTAQVLDSSRSVTANIAEGHGRFHYQENAQFCRISRGSLMETIEHMICAKDEGYVSEDILAGLRIQYLKCLKLLNGYIAYLLRRKGGSG